MLFCRQWIIFFFIINFFKKNLSGIPSVSNSLDPDQARRFVGPDLGPNCHQQMTKVATSRERVNVNSQRSLWHLKDSHKFNFYCLVKPLVYTFISQQLWIPFDVKSSSELDKNINLSKPNTTAQTNSNLPYSTSSLAHCALRFFKITGKTCGTICICLLRVHFKKRSTRLFWWCLWHLFLIFFKRKKKTIYVVGIHLNWFHKSMRQVNAIQMGTHNTFMPL